MKFAEINKRFTELTAEYIAKGYTFNASTMSGHQGEIAKVDLTNGVEVIRIVIDNTRSKDNFWIDGICVAVCRCTDDVKPNSSSSWATFWTQNAEVIYEESYFEIGRNSCEKFYGTYEEALVARELSHKRYIARKVSTTNRALTPSAALIRQLKHRKGFTNATRNNITVERRESGYAITMAGRNGAKAKCELIRFPKAK